MVKITVLRNRIKQAMRDKEVNSRKHLGSDTQNNSDDGVKQYHIDGISGHFNANLFGYRKCS